MFIYQLEINIIKIEKSINATQRIHLNHHIVPHKHVQFPYFYLVAKKLSLMKDSFEGYRLTQTTDTTVCNARQS